MATGLIGRDHPASLLRAEIGRAADSHGGLLLVTGEAGIGKTTLVTDAAEEVRRRGGLVLSGSCWDSDSAPGYWPWVQVIRGLRRAAEPDELAAAERAAGPGLAVLLGESAGTDGGSEPGSEFQLLDAATTALVSVSHNRPVVVVLEDLHWADTGSLKLLEFAAQHTWFERLLLIGTYRDVEVEADDHPLRPVMTSLLAKATTVTLSGLGTDEVGALIARTSGAEPPAELVREVHRRTGGNPFFVEQLARLWHGGSAIGATPPGVRDAVRRRLELLPAPVRALLTSAAVLGREFHRQVLASVVSAPVAQVDRQLEQAATARLVSPLGGGRFAFAHDLVRETLYDSLAEDDRRGRHAAIVRAVDGTPALHGEVHAADLARHAYLGGDELATGRAIELLLAAARDADNRFAVDEAVGHYRRAYELAQADPRRRVLLGSRLGQALWRSRDRDAGRDVFDVATASARALGDPALLARVALARYLAGDDQGEPLLAEAHREMLPERDKRSLSAHQLARELAARLAALAREDGDDDALAFSLSAQHHNIWALGDAGQRLALTEELIAVARRTGDAWLEHMMASFRWVALLELGDPRYLDQFRELAAMVDRGQLVRFASAFHIDRAIIAALTGRFADAMLGIERAVAEFEEYSFDGGFGYFVDHLRWSVLLRQGRTGDVEELVRSMAKNDHPHPRLVEGITAARRGDLPTALRCLPDYRTDPEPYSGVFAPLGLRFLAETAALAKDPELCAIAEELLAPHSGRWVVVLYGCDVNGPVDLWLGMLDVARERWDAAVDRLTAAYRSADRLGARPWAVEARARLAEALFARNGTGDRKAAATLREQVAKEAAELDLHDLYGPTEQHGRAEQRGQTGPIGPADRSAQPGPGDLAPSMPVEKPSDSNEFRRDGPVWTLRFDDLTVRVPDTKGLRDLHQLLGSPGTDIPSVRLLDPEGGDVVVAARKLGGDPVLDDEAKAAYRRRLDRLDEEIDLATARGDDRRAVEFDRERAALLEELRAAAGLAGRTRRLGDEAERARKTVTARIRDTLRKLDRLHPALAAHLRASVTTGSTCRYQPAAPTHWRR